MSLLRRRTACSTLLAFLGMVAVACGPATPSPTLPDPESQSVLGDVVMMTWTTRSAEGLLGHVMERGNLIRIDTQRRPIDGTPREIATDQTLRVVIAVDHQADVGAGYSVVGAEAKARHLTHVAYDVRLTGYVELLPAEQRYVAASGCCIGGQVSQVCGDMFVARMMRGSGKVEYLQQVDAEASVDAADVVRARGGTSYRRLSTSEFKDTYFAYEVAPLDAVCSRISPDQEMQAMRVAPPNNCFVSIFHRDGSRSSKKFHLPDAELCRKVASANCSAEGVLECRVMHGRDAQAKEIAVLVPATEPAAPPSTAAAFLPADAGSSETARPAMLEEPTAKPTPTPAAASGSVPDGR